ncbi:hypothetical protein BDDG_12494 [Blastomyces dermatitidis ATCC 18188]|uniref:Uncharacterized protein n=1 Tax=Ajellomyces dermatitidis (strain ATCC 18188 / CBS 674.68) TaxID=653446 RepID=A0A0J9EPP9_AJEDA|nr:hypothetical protein BDDG_12494 [Blastomyces dermatitidis ATCC 18188]
MSSSKPANDGAALPCYKIAAIRGDGIGPEVIEAGNYQSAEETNRVAWILLNWPSRTLSGAVRITRNTADISPISSSTFLWFSFVNTPDVPDHISL